MRLIRKWLNAGVLEKEVRTFAEAGSQQGGSASPLLANIYLHCVFDLWVQAWRKKRAHGDVIVVRYADDALVGFEFKDDAERFWAELKERVQKFQLELLRTRLPPLRLVSTIFSDLGDEAWRRKHTHGDLIVVRYTYRCGSLVPGYNME